MSSVPCNESKMEICKQDKVVSQKSNEMIIPMQQGVPGNALILQHFLRVVISVTVM